MVFHLSQVGENCRNLPVMAAYARLLVERVGTPKFSGVLQGYIVQEEDWDRVRFKVTNSHIEHKIRTITLFDDFDAIITIVSTVPDAKYAVEAGLPPDALAAIVESLPDSIVRCGSQER